MYRCQDYAFYGQAEHRVPQLVSYQQPQTFYHPPPHSEQPVLKPILKPKPPYRRKAPPHTSVVGRSGYPEPSPQCLEKAPFSADDNAKLKDLKERTDPVLTWKQIGDFFPGRTFNTLQVHYCTKIKGTNVTWTAELDDQLRAAIKDDEALKGRRVAKVFRGSISADECEARMRIIGPSTHPQHASGSLNNKSNMHDATKDMSTRSLVSDDIHAKSEEHQSEDPPSDGFYPTKRRRLEPLARSPSTRDESGQSSAFWSVIDRHPPPSAK